MFWVVPSEDSPANLLPAIGVLRSAVPGRDTLAVAGEEVLEESEEEIALPGPDILLGWASGVSFLAGLGSRYLDFTCIKSNKLAMPQTKET